MSKEELDQHEDASLSGELPEKKDSSSRRQHYRWFGFGIELVGVIGLFMWLGYLADQKFENERPWWMLTGFALAFIGMMYPLIKEAFGLNQPKSKKK